MEKKSLKGRLDYVSMIIPLLGVVLYAFYLCLCQQNLHISFK